MNKDVLVKTEGGVISVSLNRPEALNALSADMVQGLQEAIRTAKENPEIRAMLITGEGRSFCSGGDVKGMGDGSPVQIYDHIGSLNELILQMTELDKPIIAAIHGYAAGAGVCLALACDQIVAADDAKFVLSFSKIGLISDGGSLFFLPRTLGVFRAKELLFNAEPISAVQAKEWGFVNRLHPADQLREEALGYALKLANGPTRTYGVIKRLANQALTTDLAAILQAERSAQSMIGTTADHKEGIRAFMEKRSPNFTGE